MPKAAEIIGKIESNPLASFEPLEGEIFAGMYAGPDGHLVRFFLLPRDSDPAPWEEQRVWAEALGGELPNRIEQSMLFAFLRDQFKKTWYWSNATLSSNCKFAWGQHFRDGYQTCCFPTSYELRARAVRRVAI